MVQKRRQGGIERRKGFEKRNTARLICELRQEWYSCHGQGD